MNKTIILPTDFSDSARNAYDYAFGLFGFKNVRYILCNTYVVVKTRMDFLISWKATMSKISIEGLENELAYCQQKYRGENLEIEILSQVGTLAPALEKLIEKEKVDFIVMGATGSSEFEKVFLGSNVTRVIRNVPCPTIVVPSGTVFDNLYSIAFAASTDSDNYKSLAPLNEIAMQYDSKLLVFNVSNDWSRTKTNAKNIKKNMQEFLKSIPYDFTIVCEDDIMAGIEKVINENDINLLVMVAKQYDFFEALFHQSMTKNIALHLGKTPLLVLHEK